MKGMPWCFLFPKTRDLGREDGLDPASYQGLDVDQVSKGRTSLGCEQQTSAWQRHIRVRVKVPGWGVMWRFCCWPWGLRSTRGLRQVHWALGKNTRS